MPEAGADIYAAAYMDNRLTWQPRVSTGLMKQPTSSTSAISPKILSVSIYGLKHCSLFITNSAMAEDGLSAHFNIIRICVMWDVLHLPHVSHLTWHTCCMSFLWHQPTTRIRPRCSARTCFGQSFVLPFSSMPGHTTVYITLGVAWLFFSPRQHPG